MVPLRIIHRSASACFTLNRSSKSSSMHEKGTKKCSTSSDAWNDSCNSLCWDNDEDILKIKSTPSHDRIGNKSERPLRNLCRTVRRFASLHSSKSTISTAEMLDSVTTLSLEEDEDDDACSFGCDDEDDEVDDCNKSNDKNRKVKRVRFSTRAPTIHTVEHSRYMDPQQREDCWYLRQEMNQLKYESRLTRTILQKEGYCHLKDFVLDVFMRCQLLAECGLQDDQVPHYHSDGGVTQPSSMSRIMAAWCDANVAGESCRGLEKRIIGRASLHGAAREFVLKNNARASCGVSNNDADGDASKFAQEYQALSHSALIFAQCTAKADAMVAAGNWWR